jgi:large subunit ribosomal protein L3
MTLGLIGKKIGMTRIYDDSGRIVPVTVIQAGPCPIVQVKRTEADGYTALQLGFDPIPERKLNRPRLGHFKKHGCPPMRVVREFRVQDVEGRESGATLDVTLFVVGEIVDVIGVSKGRGFAGTMKRHHSSRGPETHGSRYHRRPGSMGGSSDPSRVWKGKKLPGQMGNQRVTMRNLKVVKIDLERNLLLVRGAVPGHSDGYIMVAKSKKESMRAARKG